jgi:hypothetical protein
MRSLLVFFVLFSQQFAHAQESNRSITYAFGMTRFDFFTGFEYHQKLGKFDPFCGFEVGVNRTFFQQRFFPKVKIGTNYYLLRKDRFLLGPSLNYGYSLLNVNKSTSSYHRWHELMGGFRFLYGRNFKIGFTLLGGWTAERFPNQLTNTSATVHSSAYHGAILVNYVF